MSCAVMSMRGNYSFIQKKFLNYKIMHDSKNNLSLKLSTYWEPVSHRKKIKKKYNSTKSANLEQTQAKNKLLILNLIEKHKY